MAIFEGAISGNRAEVDINGNQLVVLEKDVSTNPGRVSAIKIFCENDDGAITGTPLLISPETDADYRLRGATDLMLDNETLNYAAQNTGKHTYVSTTLAFAWGTVGLTTNSGNITTLNTGANFGTYAEFPVIGSASVYCEMEGSFNNTPVTNTTIDFGLFRRGVTTQFAPSDGAYFRLNSTGLLGVINYNSTEVQVPFTVPFAYTLNKKYQFIITLTQREVFFWIDGILQGSIETPNAQGQPFLSATLPFSVRHAIAAGGGASAAISFNLNSYAISLGGPQIVRTLGEMGNATYGSYQGLSGGTMGKLISGTVTTGTLVVPTAAVPLNASLAANLCNGLGGRSYETFTAGLALAVDGIIQAYQVPVGSGAFAGRRLRLTGVKLSGYIQTVLAGGPTVAEYKLAFGGTAASLATAEGIAAKAPRLVMLPELTQFLTATQAVSTAVSQPFGSVATFDDPIYVNPGEFISLVVVRAGTALTAGVQAHNIQFVYSWE